MNKKLLITNNINCHYEIIESIIVKYCYILNIENGTKLDIYLDIYNNPTFKNYIHSKYPNIKFEKIQYYDYYINCTIYDRDFNSLNKEKDSTNKYISHEITSRLKTNPNVYYLTPLSKTNYLYTDILPFSNRKTSNNIPIYIIQGNLNQNRRYLELCKKILDTTYKYKYLIKIVGRGTLPKMLETYKDKIVLRNNLDFVNYHKEFLDAYCILPLISKNTHPHYYTNKLTSTINYTRGYKLKCLIDYDLQQIYNLPDVEVYNDINDIQISFEKTLYDFYNNDLSTY
jgi:hypothetical protein